MIVFGVFSAFAAWDPTRDAWSGEAVAASFEEVGERVAPSAFLGDVSAMRPFSEAEWAWFATGFDPVAYASVAVAPPRNGMGRSKLTGDALVQDLEIAQLRKWRVIAGTSADLVIYTNLRWFTSTANGVSYVVETIGVDQAENVVFKLQYRAGVTVGRVGSLVADDRDRFAYVLGAATEVGREFRVILEDAAAGGEMPGGVASPLHADRSTLVSSGEESFGPALAQQVSEWVRVVEDETVDVEVRADVLRDLGRIGATAVIPAAEGFLRDRKERNVLQESAAWALGEIGHPDALDALRAARGVDSFDVKAALTKIEVY